MWDKNDPVKGNAFVNHLRNEGCRSETHAKAVGYFGALIFVGARSAALCTLSKRVIAYRRVRSALFAEMELIRGQ